MVTACLLFTSPVCADVKLTNKSSKYTHTGLGGLSDAIRCFKLCQLYRRAAASLKTKF